MPEADARPVFELKGRTVRFAHFNARVEKSGQNDTKPAADLKIQIDLPNDELAMFHRDLKASLYHYDPQIQGDLVDAAKKDENPEYAPTIRFSKLAPVEWDLEIENASVRIDYGVGGRDIELDGCKVNKFSFEPRNGGTVVTTFRIQGHPDGEQAGHLYDLQGSEITLTVVPPPPLEEPPETGELVEEA